MSEIHTKHLVISFPNIEYIFAILFIFYVGKFSYIQYKHYETNQRLKTNLTYFNSIIVGVYSGCLYNLLIGHNKKNILTNGLNLNLNINKLERGIDYVKNMLEKHGELLEEVSKNKNTKSTGKCVNTSIIDDISFS